jgi:hypothetical protein
MPNKHLIGAVRDYLLVQLAATPLAGKIVDNQADRDKGLPYLVLEQADSRSLLTFGNHEVRWASLVLTVVSTTREQAEALAWRVRDALYPPGVPPQEAPWTPLALRDGWTDVGRVPAGGESVEIDPETRAAGGADVWTARLPFTWTISRG